MTDEKPESKPAKGHNRRAEAEDAPNQPIVPAAEKRPENQSGPKNNHKTLKKWECFERVFKIVEFVGIFAALAGIYVLWKQYDVMQKSFQIDERAWVAANKGAINNFGVNDNSVAFEIFFKNTGKSPAMNVVTVMGATIESNSIPRKDERPNGQAGGLLAPDAEMSITTAEHPFDNRGIEAIKSGLPYFIYGTVWYDDIFGNQHWSQFCWKVRISPSLGFEPTAIHNSCDNAKSQNK